MFVELDTNFIIQFFPFFQVWILHCRYSWMATQALIYQREMPSLSVGNKKKLYLSLARCNCACKWNRFSTHTDVIHTDGGIFGIPWALGHVDFYPNGGIALQPGCVQEELSKNNIIGIIGEHLQLTIPFRFNWWRWAFSVGCSHVRAWQYFAESVRRPTAFLADRCEHTNNESKECVQSIKAFMGLQSDHRLRGKYYLDTNPEPPFGRNFPI